MLNVLWLTSCFRHIRKADSTELNGSRDVQVQDVHLPRPTQPHLQGDLCVPGSSVPALWRHAYPVGLQQAQHEKEGDDWLDLSGAEQLWGGGADTLDTDEGIEGTTGVSMAQSFRVLESQQVMVMMCVMAWVTESRSSPRMAPRRQSWPSLQCIMRNASSSGDVICSPSQCIVGNGLEKIVRTGFEMPDR